MGEDRPIIYLMGPSALDRQAYRLLLQQELGLRVDVESGFTPVAVWAAMRARPDLVLVLADRAAPEVRDAVQMIPRLRKTTRVLIVSASVEEAILKDWAQCDIAGYAVKDGGIEELRPAIESILAGQTFYSAGVREVIEEGRKAAVGLTALSQREIELLPLLARGMRLREAAKTMMVSYKTADSYRTSLLRKLGVRDRVELARYAIRQHIIDP
jgi:two-component system nitrate/nitrite response regulator NarL